MGRLSRRALKRKKLGWVKKSAQSFCFKVKRLEGKSSNQCVGGLLEQEPTVKIDYQEDRAKVSLEGFDNYELYFSLEDPWSGKKTSQSFELERDYVERCYFVVGKKDKDYSKPVKFCLEPLPHPPIREVERLEYRIVGEIGFICFGPTSRTGFLKSLSFLKETKRWEQLQDTSLNSKGGIGRTLYRVKVRSIYGKESQGVEVLYNP
jgi:hypothetical protein